MPKYKEATIKDLKAWAAVGAETRYAQLQTEMSSLVRQFPHLDTTRSEQQKKNWSGRRRRQKALGLTKRAKKTKAK